MRLGIFRKLLPVCHWSLLLQRHLHQPLQQSQIAVEKSITSIGRSMHLDVSYINWQIPGYRKSLLRSKSNLVGAELGSVGFTIDWYLELCLFILLVILLVDFSREMTHISPTVSNLCSVASISRLEIRFCFGWILHLIGLINSIID